MGYRQLAHAGFARLWFALLLLLLTRPLNAEKTEAVVLPAPALLTKDQLLERVVAMRSAVKDLSVVTNDTVLKGPENMVRDARRTVLLKSEMIYVNEVYSFGQDKTERTFHVQIAFDGRQTATEGRPPGRAMITKGRSRELDTDRIGFFTINLLNPPRRGGFSSSLLGSLQHSQYIIRKEVERIDGQACEVVEFAGPSGKLIVWLDLERGLLPLRQHWFRPDNKLWRECNIERGVEVEKGLWFATRGTMTTFPVFKNLPEMNQEIEQLVTVDAGPDGPLLAVNQNPEDANFDLASRLPVGTMLARMDETREWRIVGFGKEKKLVPATAPATAPAARVVLPLMVAPAPPAERKVEFDLRPWGESVQGVSARFCLSREDGARLPYIDVQNRGELNLNFDSGRPRLEFDGKWYKRQGEQQTSSALPPTRTIQGVGPIFFSARWLNEQGVLLARRPGHHTIRVKYIATPADGKGDVIEFTTAPLSIEIDATGQIVAAPGAAEGKP